MMILLAFLLVFLNGFFVAVEFAIVKVRATRVRELAIRGSANAKVAQEIIARLDAYLSACQLGITLASLGLGWIGEPAFAGLIEPGLVLLLGELAGPASHAISVAVAFSIITALHIVLGELAPKSVAIRFPEATSLFTARPMRWFFRVFYPAIWALNGLALGLLQLVGIPAASETELGHSEEELRLLLAESAGRGAMGERRRMLIEQALTFSSRRVREIMVPRADVASLDLQRSLDEILAVARRDGYTRYPLIREQLDDVVGVVHVRDLFAGGEHLREAADLERLAREALFVPESATADQCLRLFQQRRLHMAMVVDEYGGTAGLVTLEDVIEELAGEIQDEFDVETPPIVDLGNGCARVAGSLPVVDLGRHLETRIETEDAVTVGGLIQEELGRVARTGDVVRVGDLGLKVLETRSRRIVRVLAGPWGTLSGSVVGRNA